MIVLTATYASGTVEVRTEQQRSPVADEVSALIAVARPILVGLLGGLKAEVVAELGGREEVKLKMLSRLRRRGDGDVGICFEYAVHDAVRNRNAMVLERVHDSLTRLCGIDGDDLRSILFAAEKTGAEQLIDTARDLVTADSRLMAGTRGRPALLARHIEGIAQAFRRPDARLRLPSSIGGVWKADLFLGMTDTERWVATTVKVNPGQLEGARGLRVGIVPASHTETDLPYKDERKNLVVCPLLHDGNFMQIFYEGWQIVETFLAADGHVPPEVALPRPASRQVARMLEDRREFPVLQVVRALEPLAQPELLATEAQQADVELTRGDASEVRTIVVPEASEIPRRP